MLAIKIIELCAGLAAIGALVAAGMLDKALDPTVVGMLSFVAGFVLKRPSDMLTPADDRSSD